MEGQSVLNPLDIIIVAVIIFGMVRGAKKGIFRITAGIASIVLSILLALRFWYVAQNIYLDTLKLQLSSQWILILSFGTVFVISYIVLSRLLDYLDELGKKVKIDNALGAILGGGIATLLLSVVFVIFSYANFPSEANARGSVLYSHVKNFSRLALGVGVKALYEANQQVNKYGLTRPVPRQDQGQQPSTPTTSKPTPVR